MLLSLGERTRSPPPAPPNRIGCEGSASVASLAGCDSEATTRTVLVRGLLLASGLCRKLTAEMVERRPISISSRLRSAMHAAIFSRNASASASSRPTAAVEPLPPSAAAAAARCTSEASSAAVVALTSDSVSVGVRATLSDCDIGGGSGERRTDSGAAGARLPWMLKPVPWMPFAALPPPPPFAARTAPAPPLAHSRPDRPAPGSRESQPSSRLCVGSGGRSPEPAAEIGRAGEAEMAGLRASAKSGGGTARGRNSAHAPIAVTPTAGLKTSVCAAPRKPLPPPKPPPEPAVSAGAGGSSSSAKASPSGRPLSVKNSKALAPSLAASTRTPHPTVSPSPKGGPYRLPSLPSSPPPPPPGIRRMATPSTPTTLPSPASPPPTPDSGLAGPLSVAGGGQPVCARPSVLRCTNCCRGSRRELPGVAGPLPPPPPPAGLLRGSCSSLPTSSPIATADGTGSGDWSLSDVGPSFTSKYRRTVLAGVAAAAATAAAAADAAGCRMEERRCPALCEPPSPPLSVPVVASATAAATPAAPANEKRASETAAANAAGSGSGCSRTRPSVCTSTAQRTSSSDGAARSAASPT
ncbi:hypothetical protein T492DRAFT_1039035 [Pavlovales sp. CCMP2436]|nr:hypothetical protein T492DRAFT_1039035 [Pavlovales sp. CCMP2436]